VRAAADKRVSSVAVFEAGTPPAKGGSIRRLTEAMDPRLYGVIPVAAPTDEEKAHHYLWRFWRHLPRAGRVTIYDRSWYGRLLVERVEGFAKEDEWIARLPRDQRLRGAARRGRESCSPSFWIHISPRSSFRRFEDRRRTPYKRHKMTDEDWRNRDRWAAYHTAVNDMVVRTSTPPRSLDPGGRERQEVRAHPDPGDVLPAPELGVSPRGPAPLAALVGGGRPRPDA